MENEIAAAQARRDRAKLLAAERRIAGLEHDVQLITTSRSWRLTAPLRAALTAVRRQPASPPEATVPTPAPAPAPELDHLRAIVIDSHWPQPDRDAGSMEIVTLVEALLALGWSVTFAAALDHAGGGAEPQPARDALARRGVRCLGLADAPSVAAFIEAEAVFDLCVLCRVYCGGNFLEAVQRHWPATRIVFNTIDLHFLRAQRQAALDSTLAPDTVKAVQEREEAVVAGSDATLVVSNAERDLLRTRMPASLIVQMPLARAVAASVAGFDERRGIGFIGGFAHSPNVDAVRWFTGEVWPLVLRDDPTAELEVVGADMPDGLLAGVPGTVRALGHVPDVEPWFRRLRLTVAPLRFGAGAKGKVASSLAAGVPCVATTVAAEGMTLQPGEHVLVADTPEDFAAAIRQVHGDPALWAHLSAGGLAYATEVLSQAGWQTRLAATLRQIGL